MMDEREAIIKFILARISSDTLMPLDWSVSDELSMLAEEIAEGIHIKESQNQ